ncbi:MAG: trimeric intracellular cation channel family protein [Clostridia bacterium]|nr:trimeric intracellular cation channel family protein [Clostridia bacterium]
MITTENVLIILEIIGTIAFAISGALVAVKVRYDVFGVAVVGAITAVGGGIMRDILIGKIPPTIFSKFYIILIAIVASFIVFIVAYYKRKNFDIVKEKIEQVNNIFDAIGLAVFTVMGMQIAFENCFEENLFLCVTIALLSAVGGGLLRDVLTETQPYIFKKHIYALASIVGALLYYACEVLIGIQVLSAVVGIVFIIGIRILATKYRWSLPKVKLED